ncbi:flagellar assembly protein FliH [Massilia psychrophila]|jgi:flagellar assembly protein FliH|uniref:Flagellar assembly protein FliH n=1 Tax=Massilia psychrophila TaxID=1603353 RepID=A0A2G8SVR5_9BURK|nr:flagellar assembly protein FliH [Massilia psychrophila]PIL37850.1 flagellar assembly protein FliH [Massilia psychrophila]
MQTAYQRWEMNSFGDNRPSVVAARPTSPPVIQGPSEQELAEIREEARLGGYDEGHGAGYADGMALGRAEAANELEHVQSIALEFGAALAAADETIAADVLDLALHLAKSMLRSALAVKPELVIPVVREAIEYLPVLQQPAVLMLNPADVALVREAIGEELDKGGWRVVQDPSIARGGCKVDTATNQIDAQLATRWERLTHALGTNLDWLGP